MLCDLSGTSGALSSMRCGITFLCCLSSRLSTEFVSRSETRLNDNLNDLSVIGFFGGDRTASGGSDPKTLSIHDPDGVEGIDRLTRRGETHFW